MRIDQRIRIHIKPSLKKIVFELWRRSINQAAKEQGLIPLKSRLERIVRDLSDIRTTYIVDSPFLITSFRTLDAFQISLCEKVLGEFDSLTVVDIGDSSGRHSQYLLGLYPDKDINCLSVNLDPVAVEKIKSKGLAAICARAENVSEYLSEVDVFLCFETLEHLMDPGGFLHDLSYKTTAKYLVITVPYLRRSRVGLSYIRHHLVDQPIKAENTHIFELCPQDWKLLLSHSGWEVLKERIYYQYPKRSLYRLTQPLWKKYDFEGFLGLVLKRSHTYSDKYEDWETGKEDLANVQMN